MASKTRGYSVSACRDGITFIVWIDELDDEGNETGRTQTIEGVQANSEEEAIDQIIKEIKQQLN